jgi:hypothetical protein
MSEDYMQNEVERRMSKRDKARAKFVQQYRHQQRIKNSPKNQVTTAAESYYDFREQIDMFGHLKATKLMSKMKYEELAETLNRDT